jgi:hypothetical protein
VELVKFVAQDIGCSLRFAEELNWKQGLEEKSAKESATNFTNCTKKVLLLNLFLEVEHRGI